MMRFLLLGDICNSQTHCAFPSTSVMRLLSLSKTITQNKLKTLAFIHHEDTRVSVGSFSPVLSVFFLYELGNTISLFLLLDHVGTGNLKISHLQNGISTHPPRGSETVILMFADDVE